MFTFLSFVLPRRGLKQFDCNTFLFPAERYDSSEHSRHRAHASSLMDEEFDAGCTRTLFVGNIEKSTTYSDLKEAFERYGEIVVSLPC